MVEYNIEHERTAAIAILISKRDQVRQQGSEQLEQYSGMRFSEACDWINRLQTKGFDPQLDWLQQMDPSIKFAIKWLKIENYIIRLNNGEDPRTILFEIISNG